MILLIVGMKRSSQTMNNRCLVILMLVSQRAEVEIVKIFGSEKAKRDIEMELARQRGAAPSFLEGVVVLYVLGFIWQEMREVLSTFFSILFITLYCRPSSSYKNIYCIKDV